MLMILKTIYIFIIFSVIITLSYGEQDMKITREYPSPSPVVKKEISASSSPLALSSSSKSISISGDIPIIINKYTKNLKTEYDKDENITVRIRILSCDRKNKIEKAYLIEEIPDGFNVISPVLSNNTNPKIFNDEGIQYLLWHFNKGLEYKKIIEYTLKGTKMGLHNLASTIVSANVVDRNGRTHDLIFVSEDLTLNIKNDPPEITNYNQDNPMFVWRKSNLSIEASFCDPENDTINSNLIFNNTMKLIKPYKSTQDNGVRSFTWDLSNYTDNDRVFYLTADDGESHKTFGPFEIITYKFTEFGKYSLFVILGAIGSLLVGISAFFGLIGIKSVSVELKSLFNLKHLRAMKNHHRILGAEKWNKRGLELHGFHKYDEAIMDFDNSIEIDPTLPEVWKNKGEALFAKRAYDEAIECFDEAIKLDTNFKEARRLKGMALKMRDPNSDAAKQYINEGEKSEYER